MNTKNSALGYCRFAQGRRSVLAAAWLAVGSVGLSQPAEAALIHFKFAATYKVPSSGPAALTKAFGAPTDAPVQAVVWFDTATGAISSFSLKIDDQPAFTSSAGRVSIANTPTYDAWMATGTAASGVHPGDFIPTELVIKILLAPDTYSSTDIPGEPPPLSDRQDQRFYVMFGATGPRGQLEGPLTSVQVSEPGSALLTLAGCAGLLGMRWRRRSLRGA